MVTCPAGKKVLSGGGYPVFDSGISGIITRVAVHRSFPSNEGSWVVSFVNPEPDGASTWHVVGYAVCASATP
jgi:hypothetical protein